MTKIRSMTMFIEDKKEEPRDSERFVSVLEIIKQLRDQSRLEGFEFKVVKFAPDFAITKTRPKTKEEKKLLPKGDTVDFKIRAVNISVNTVQDTHKMVNTKIDAYLNIKYRNGNTEIVIINGLKLKED